MKRFWGNATKTGWIFVIGLILSPITSAASLPVDNTQNEFPPLPTTYKGPRPVRPSGGENIASRVNTAIFNSNPGARTGLKPNTLPLNPNEKGFDTVAVRTAPNGHDLTMATNVKERIPKDNGKPEKIYNSFGFQPDKHGPAVRKVLSQDPQFANSKVTILEARDPSGSYAAHSAAKTSLALAQQNFNDARGNPGLKKNAQKTLTAAEKTLDVANKAASTQNAAPHAEMVILSKMGPGGDLTVSKPACELCAGELTKNKMNVQTGPGQSLSKDRITNWRDPSQIDPQVKREFPVHSPTNFGAGLIPQLKRPSSGIHSPFQGNNPLKAPGSVANSGLTANANTNGKVPSSPFSSTSTSALRPQSVNRISSPSQSPSQTLNSRLAGHLNGNGAPSGQSGSKSLQNRQGGSSNLPGLSRPASSSGSNGAQAGKSQTLSTPKRAASGLGSSTGIELRQISSRPNASPYSTGGSSRRQG